MTDYKQLWQQCLAMIREKYGEKYKHWYDIWFADVNLESYNAETKHLRLQVPSKYVSDYLETAGANSLHKAIKATFTDAESIGYIVAPKELPFADIANFMQRQSASSKDDIRHVKIANAEKRLKDGLRYFLKGKPMTWLPKQDISKSYGYDRVVEWLTDNKGKGLLCVGTPGTGKTLICQKILPLLIGNGKEIKCVNATELHDKLEELKKEPIVVIDDLGKEPRKFYGDTDQSFFELCDNAEKTGNVLIITSNLSTNDTDDERYSDSILHLYGKEVYSRLKGITNVAIFEGEDMRD